MDINTLRKNAERRIKADSLRQGIKRNQELS